MARVFRSSGDLLADRRYVYGEASAKDGDHAAAAGLFEQALELAPDWVDAWFALGRARHAAGDDAGARAAFGQCLELDPADAAGAALEAARLDGAPIAAAPQAYVAALFDAYADNFDAALVGRLDYRAPQLISAALSGRPFRRALDLGCGTGLSGAALRPLTERLEGCDLSPRMIEKAQEKGVYDALSCASIEARLAQDDGPFDLIAAVDVFAYIGDLEPTLRAIARRLAPDGVCAFTVEKNAGAADWTLRASRRFAHSEAYLRRLAASCGFQVAVFSEEVLRRDRGAEIRGLMAILRA